MWKAIKYILIYFAFQIIGVLIVVVPGYILDADKPTLIVLALGLSNLLFCWHVVRKGMVRIDKETFTIRSWTVLLLVAIAIFFFLLPEIELIERLDLPDDLGDELDEVGGTLLGLISIGFIGPIGEEFLFRGVVLRSLLEWKPIRTVPWVAVLLSAAFFSLVHMNPAQMPGTFMVGLLFGWIAYRTGSLLPGIVGHVFNNSLPCIALMLSTEESADETIAEMFHSPVLEALTVAASIFICAFFVRALVHKVNENYPPCKLDAVSEDNSFHE